MFYLFFLFLWVIHFVLAEYLKSSPLSVYVKTNSQYSRNCQAVLLFMMFKIMFWWENNYIDITSFFERAPTVFLCQAQNEDSALQISFHEDIPSTMMTRSYVLVQAEPKITSLKAFFSSARRKQLSLVFMRSRSRVWTVLKWRHSWGFVVLWVGVAYVTEEWWQKAKLIERR